MPLPIGAVLGVAAPVVGGLLGLRGQQSANMANAQQAKEQMEFQERMSNTSWQRGVADMRAAGLNPALAYQKGGASAPSGAMATMQNEAAPLAAGASSAGQAAMASAQLLNNMRMTEAQIGKLNAETNLTNASAAARVESINLQNAVLREQPQNMRVDRWARGEQAALIGLQNYLGSTYGEREKQLDLEGKDIANKFRSQELQNYPAMFRATLLNMEAQRDNLGASAAQTRNLTELGKLGLPKAGAEAAMYRNAFGQSLPYANSALQALMMGASLMRMR